MPETNEEVKSLTANKEVKVLLAYVTYLIDHMLGKGGE